VELFAGSGGSGVLQARLCDRGIEFADAGMAFRLWSRLGALLVLAVGLTGIAQMLGLLDPLALLITIGGGIGVAAMTYSRERMRHAWTLVQVSLAEPEDGEEVLATFKRLARIHRVEGLPALERAGLQAADPFLRTAIEFAADGRDADDLEAVLTGEVRRYAAEGEQARQVVLLLGKLFPAFGLIGTLIGLAHLLHNLGTATNLAAIGPGLGIAVTTTLYGAVLANVVVLPLAAKLHAHLERRHTTMQMIIDGALMVQRKEYPTQIERALRAAYPMSREPSRPSGGRPRTSKLTLAERAA
jgi:chemotaxis protein MotA